jgi:hypothetical protein
MFTGNKSFYSAAIMLNFFELSCSEEITTLPVPKLEPEGPSMNVRARAYNYHDLAFFA